MKRKKIELAKFEQCGRPYFFLSLTSKTPYVISVYDFVHTDLFLVTSVVHENSYKVFSLEDYVYIDV